MKHIVLLVAALYLVACNDNRKQEDAVDVKVADTIVDNDSVKENVSDGYDVDAVSGATDVSQKTLFNGIFVSPPQKHATVTLTMGGIVKNTSLLMGQYVKKGEVIAVLDNPEFIDLQQNYLDAVAQLEYLENEFLRQQNLMSQEAASQKRVQQSKADYLSVKSKADAMYARLSLLGINGETLKQNGLIARLDVKAPLSGYVTNVNVNIGKYLNPGDPVCDIVDNGDLMLQLTAYEKDLADIEPGNMIEFHVNGMGEKSFEAILISIDKTVDKENRSIKLFAKLKENNSQFMPGMYVSAKIKKK